MKSKSQVHRFCDLYMLNATPKNPVPTDKILRSLNNKLVAWGAEEQDLIKAIFKPVCIDTYFYNLFYFHIYFCLWTIINFRSIYRGGEPRVIGMVDTRWIETVQIIVLFCLLGISIAMLGPSLPDLGKKVWNKPLIPLKWLLITFLKAFNTESSIKQYTVIFFGRATGSFLGSWVSGWLIDNYHHTFLLPFVILGHAAFYICIPLTGQLVIVALCISLRYDSSHLANT